MKVYISNYRHHWISPYTIIKKVFFWKDGDWAYDVKQKWLVDFLNPISTAIMSVLDFLHPKIDYVKVDRWDSWNADATMAKIIYPILKQLQKIKHGSPFVDIEDVPEEFRKEVDEHGFCHEHWEYVLGEIVFAFEKLADNSWESEFMSGEPSIKSVPCEFDKDGKPTLYSLEKGEDDTFKVDHDGLNKVNVRIDNGLRLFGKYYRALWD